MKEKVKEWRRRKGHRPSIDKNLSICELVATFEGKSGRSKIEVGRLEEVAVSKKEVPISVEYRGEKVLERNVASLD